MISLWPLLLPVAAFSGWYLANYSTHEKKFLKPKPSKEYFLGLNYLLNEQSDKAIDVFIKLLEVDSDTVETHLALGSLFRRRGETDRAIRLHQNLIARPQLMPHQKIDALMALGQDYMSAGLFDRAEKIFEEVAQNEGPHQANSLKNLLDLYQREKAWEQCIESAKKLEKINGEPLKKQMAHYYCEYALLAINQGHYEEAHEHLRKAFKVDNHSVRASLLLGQLEWQQNNYKKAIKAYKKIQEQDSDYLSEVVDPLILCYQQLEKEEECAEYFQEIMPKCPRVSLLFFLAKFIKRKEGTEKALDFVVEHLEKNFSLRGLNQLIAWYLETTYGKVQVNLKMLYEITHKLLENKPVYRCVQCGYSGKNLHWLCPSCKQWSMMKPIYGLEGG